MIEQGTILDKTYKIKRAIGLGGGGEIYLADHLRLEKPVVIKKIKENMQGIIEDRGEADILKKLSNQYLPQVYDFFVENNQVYTVMEYIEGENFQQILNKGSRFSAKDVVRWGTQLSEVLAYLHSQTPPIIHRDIKPANIMLTPKGNVCLIDFNVSFGQDSKNVVQAHSDGYSPPEQYGVASRGDGAPSPAYDSYGSYHGGNAGHSGDDETEILSDSSNQIIQDAVTEILSANNNMPEYEASFTPRIDSRASSAEPSCMSRAEQNCGMMPSIDERSDVYSLGASLYHMIVGKRPEKATEKVTPLSECNARVSDGLIYIIEKAMQKAPENRFQTAKKMHEAFVNIRKLDHEYISYARKRDLLAGIIIALACTSVVCTVLGYKKMGAEAYNAYVSQIKSANELRLNGEFEAADEACRQAVAMRPDDFTAYIELVHIYYMWQYYGEGVKTVQSLEPDEAALTEDGREQWATLQFLAGECYMGLEEFNLAAGSYKKAIEFQPKESIYYTRCAIALAREGDEEGAEKFLEDALQKGISDAAIYLTKAEILLSGSKYEEAEELINKVLEMSDDSDINYHAYLTGSRIYEEGKESIEDALDKERRLLEEAVGKLDSSYKLSLSEKLADVYYEMSGEEKDEEKAAGYYEKALGYFNEIYQSGYKNMHVLQNIAIINQTLGDYEAAEDILFSMIEIYPEDYRGYMYLTQMYAEIQNNIPIDKRDYEPIFDNYNKADNLYKRSVENGGSVDTNMQILGNMIEDMKKTAD